jgi:2-polyprenyl-3-methyl-5-hydroxy-6-metoxy-1,4-benzoquinol methylase
VTSAAWRRWREQVDLDEYEARFADGEGVHGEADLVASLAPTSVLDAGCGTGRVAVELARRGIDVVGVDADPDMLERAQRRRPELTWVLADLATLSLDGRFDVVVMAGNILPFAEPGSRAAIVATCAGHLAPGGWLVVGAGLQRGWPSVDELDAWASDAGLVLDVRYGGWDRSPFSGGYAVSIYAAA